MTGLLPAELAWYATGRFYADEKGMQADYGYFLHLPFGDIPLFAGPSGAGAAHFTFAARPFMAKNIFNGALTLGRDPVGEFSLYLQREPAGTFDDPASFAHGECIATFRRTSVVVGTVVGQGAETEITPLFGTNVFSARLIASTPFEFYGGTHDLSRHIGQGVTQFGTAAASPAEPTPPGYKTVIPFTGSAIALGGTS